MPFRLSIASRGGRSPSMAKSRLQICLPEDPFYDLKENRTPARNGTQHTASPGKPLKTPKSSRSKDRRLECLQWALETAQEQQVALLEGARTQLEDARGQVSHLQAQLAQLQGQLAGTEGQLAQTQGQLAQSDGQLMQLQEQLTYVADCRHTELNTHQAEVAKLRSENLGLLHENRALASITSDHKTEHEKQINDLVLHFMQQRDQYLRESADEQKSVADERDAALLKLRDLTASLESVREGFKGIEAERDKLRKEAEGLGGLQKERNGAVADVRALRADLSSAQQNLKRAIKANGLWASELKMSERVLQHVRTKLDGAQKDRDGLQGQLEREKAASAAAEAKFETAESARARARKDLESAIARLVESQRARAALQREVAQGLEALAGAKELRECEGKAAQERVARLEDEARRLSAALQMPPPRFGVSERAAAERASASASMTSPAAEKNAAGGSGAEKERGVSGQSAAAVRPTQKEFEAFGGALGNRNVNTFPQEGATPMCAQSGHVNIPSFVFGSADNHSGPGLRRNSLGSRRKAPVTKKPGVKNAPGDSIRENDRATPLPSDGSAAAKLAGVQGLGGAVSGSDVSAASDVSHVGAIWSLIPSIAVVESEDRGGQNSQPESATCAQKNGALSGGRQTEREGKTGSGISNLKKVMGCLKKHLPVSLHFGRAVNPTEERRVWGFRRTAVPQLQTGRLRRRNARRLAAEVHTLIGLMVQLERCGLEIGP